jgi:hypothetical protein
MRYTGIGASARRVRAVLRRHAYLILKSPTRIVSMMYYPTVTMIVWAFLTLYLAPTNNFLKDAPGFFIGAVLLWDVLFRGQLGVSLTFIEEFYARNLGNLFVSPLTLPEYVVAQLTISVVRALDWRRRRVSCSPTCCFDSPSFRSGFRSIAFFAEPAGVRLGDRPRDVGCDPAPRPLRRRARVGGDLHPGARVRRLLPDLGAAVVAAADFARRAVRAHVRRHARAPDPRHLPLGSLLGGRRAQRRLPGARRGVFAWSMRDARQRGTLLQMGE